MADFGQIAQHRHRVCPIGILRRQFRQRPCRIAAQDQIKQIQNTATIRQPQHGAHHIGTGFSRAIGNGLIQQTGRIAGRSFGSAGNQRQRAIGDLRAFGSGDFAQKGHLHFGFDPFQIKPLAAGQHSHRHFANFRGGKDEFHMRGRFFQRFEQRVERRIRQHVHFVDDIDFIAGRCRAIVNGINHFAHITHACARCCVHFQHIHMPPFGNGDAWLADAARLGRGAARTIGANAIEPLGDDSRRGGFARAADARHHKGMGNAIGGEGVFQRAHHRLLPDQIGKSGGAVFARQHLIGFLARFGHIALQDSVVAD